MKQMTKLALGLGLMVLVAIMAGCSSDSPLAPTTLSESSGGTMFLTPADGEPVQFGACVATVNQAQRMLTFAGRSDTVIAAHTCQIVRLLNDQETPVPFVDIQSGDSLQVNGVSEQNGYVTATRLRICSPGDGQYDLAFRDTIVAIDYAAGSFTVAGRSETILVDGATLIWGNIVTRHQGSGNEYQNQEMAGGGCAKLNPDFYTTSYDTILALTDLAVGDVVEVKANIVDETTLLAVKIKLANCDQKECVVFTAALASVDVEAATVTFDGYDWTGVVCKNARLIGLDGELLTLTDFAAGELVSVKGFPL
ncbi:MAG: DUF5666 domain-containing protein, partial [candidate division Zixibacteria bacterium]|nr:DUF5666 domain-containing protein [candidate division Zixibacteria bacterium]